jgi:hypothetical protein
MWLSVDGVSGVMVSVRNEDGDGDAINIDGSGTKESGGSYSSTLSLAESSGD